MSEIPEEEIATYEEYKRNRDKFIALLKSGMFDMQSGKAEVNMHNNQIQNVYLYQMAYRRKSED